MIRRCLAATRRLCLKPASVLMLLSSTSQVVAQDLQLGVDLSPGPSGDWVVAYTLSEPVAALVFARGNGDYRKHSWSFSDDQFVIDRIGGTDKIRRRDNEAFSEVIASLKPYTDKPSKDYTPFLRFSDGGMAVFTGQFIVGEPMTPLESDFIDGASNRNTLFPPSASLRVTPGEFSRMIVGARIVEQSTVLELGDGEYIYFGTADALETPALTAVTDKAAPDWLRRHLYDSMAMTFEFFERRLGPMSGGKPFMLTVFRPLEGGRISFTGGVIGSQLAIELGLGERIADSPEEREFMARFFAHESAHLWNNSGVYTDDPGDAWIHEGGAEASSWLALEALGLQEPSAARKEFERAANDCAGSLERGPLRDAYRRDDYRGYYDCGAVIALATHGFMRRQGEDLFDFWRELIELGRAGGGAYNADHYFRLASLKAPGFDEQLRSFIDQPHTDGRKSVSELLASAGIDILSDEEEQLKLTSMP